MSRAATRSQRSGQMNLQGLSLRSQQMSMINWIASRTIHRKAPAGKVGREDNELGERG